MSGANVVRVHGPHYRRKHSLKKKRRVTESGCWEWTGSTNNYGYGQYRTSTTNLSVHRVSWEIYVGPIPEKHQVHHLCENPLCFNPEHLEVMSHGDHVRLHEPGRKRWS